MEKKGEEGKARPGKRVSHTEGILLVLESERESCVDSASSVVSIKEE